MYKGHIIRLKPKQSGSRIVVVPHTQSTHGWNCTVVFSEHERYPVGGYDIHVFDRELAEGRRLNIRPKPRRRWLGVSRPTKQ